MNKPTKAAPSWVLTDYESEPVIGYVSPAGASYLGHCFVQSIPFTVKQVEQIEALMSEQQEAA